MESEIYVFTIAGDYHPKYGPYDITGFIPPPDTLFARIEQLVEQGDPGGELDFRLRQIDTMARLICRDTAIYCAIAADDRLEMPDDVRALLDLCLPPAQPSAEAFPLWLNVARTLARLELDAVRTANLQPDVKAVLEDYIQRRLKVARKQTSSPVEQAMQILVVWMMSELLALLGRHALCAAALTTVPQHVREKTFELCPLDGDYLLTLSEVPSLSLPEFDEKFRKIFRRYRRLNQNPGGTGKNAEYEHEIAESDLPLPEDEPSPLELAPSSEPDPADVVADEDAVSRALARFGKRTADLLRLMMEGKSASEAAEELGISPSTARTLLERARKQFSRTP